MMRPSGLATLDSIFFSPDRVFHSFFRYGRSLVSLHYKIYGKLCFIGNSNTDLVTGYLSLLISLEVNEHLDIW